MARRGNGEGSISKRKDGRWQGRLTIFGGRRISVYGRTRAEVVKKLNAAKSDAHTGALVEPSSMTVRGWLDHWLNNIHCQRVADSTLGQDRCMISKHVVPYLGDYRLSVLSADHVDWLLGELDRAGASGRTKQKAHGVLRKALNIAVQKRLITVNPVLAVKAPRADTPEREALDAAGVRQLLGAAKGDRYEALYYLAIHTGMRWGEIAGLTWRDIDLQGGVLRVVRTQRESYHPEAEDGEKWRISLAEPKSKASRRAIHITAATVAMLKAHRRQLDAIPHPHARVFTSPSGEPLRRSNFGRREWHPMRKKAGLRHMGFHSLRHTMATAGLSTGLHPKVIQQRLGHSRIALTLDTYSHVLPELQEGAAEALEKALSGDAN